MRVLALDTALGAAAAALMDVAAGDATVIAGESLAMERGHAEALMPLLARVLEAAGTDGTGVERIAVTTGPGSFTGLRGAVSAARALALAWRVPAVGVPTLAAMAADGRIPAGRAVLAVSDARRGEAYWQMRTPGGAFPEPPRIDRYEDIAAAAAGPAVVVGTGAARLCALAPGRLAALEGIEVADIRAVGLLGAGADPAASPARPLYIRPPDARLPTPPAGRVLPPAPALTA